MAAKSLISTDEDEFFDMEVASFSNFLLSEASSPNPHDSSEFEFQKSSSSSSSSSIFHHSESPSSPADELFYKGKLLPLHLPPRVQMVQQILKNDQSHSLPVSFHSLNESISERSQSKNPKDYSFDKFYNIPFMVSDSTPITVTPFRSCNSSSPYESFRVSDNDMIRNPEEKGDQNQKKKKKAWNQHFSLVSKLKTWFEKVSSKYELAFVAKKVADEGSATKARESKLDHHHKKNGMGKKLYSFGGQIIQRSDRDRFRCFSSRIEFRRSIDIIDRNLDGILVKGDENGINRRIRSSLDANSKLCFNGSSSFSGLSNKSYGSCQELDQVGNLIMGAIAYCKQSHQQYCN